MQISFMNVEIFFPTSLKIAIVAFVRFFRHMLAHVDDDVLLSKRGIVTMFALERFPLVMKAQRVGHKRL